MTSLLKVIFFQRRLCLSILVSLRRSFTDVGMAHQAIHFAPSELTARIIRTFVVALATDGIIVTRISEYALNIVIKLIDNK